MRLRLLLLLLCAALFACGPQPRDSSDSGQPGGSPDAGKPDASVAKDGGTGIAKIQGLTVGPLPLAVEAGALTGVNATATFDDGTEADVTASVEWQVSPTSVAQVELGGGEAHLRGLAAGSAQLRVKTGSITSADYPVTVTVKSAPDAGTDAGVPAPADEVRAIWVTRFAYNTAAQVQGIINRAAAAGFNVVYFQIRGNGDAFYKSSLAPWAQKLSGTLGQDPGWDPLQTAIDAAHAKGMQLHAYWNVFAAWPCSGAACMCQPTQGMADSCVLPPASPTGQPNHLLRDHPEYMAVDASGKNVDSEYFWFSPGNAAVRTAIIAAADELLTRYAVDGLHLDRVRYAGTGFSHDAASEAAYAALPNPKPTWADWQRQNVTDTVAAIYAKVKLRRPKAVLSASVWGIYKPLPGCSTSQGFGNYYQDSLGWMKAGAIDALTPMIYWDIGTGCTDWAKLLDGFMAGANGRHIVAGMHALDKLPAGSVPSPERMAARIAYGRKVGAAGTSVFASTYLEASASWPEQWSSFRTGGAYAQDAGWPAMPWR